MVFEKGMHELGLTVLAPEIEPEIVFCGANGMATYDFDPAGDLEMVVGVIGIEKFE